MVRAFAADRTIARREATENDFIAVLEDEGYSE